MKKFLSFCAFSLIFVFILSSVYHILSWKDTSEPYISVVEQLDATDNNLIDLAFLGSSHIYYNVNPADFWNEKGISAFDLAISTMNTDSSEYRLRQLFKSQSPKVVCLDLFALQFSKFEIENVYRNFLSMDFSLDSVLTTLHVKPETLNSQADTLDTQPKNSTLNYILRWPIIHTRYQELQSFDFVQYPFSVFGRGHNYYFDTKALEQDPNAVSTSRVTELSDVNREWLDTMIDLCAENGSQLFTIIAPMIVTEEQQAIFNGAKQYLASRGIECLDLNQSIEDIGLDYATDFKDEGHLNAQGAEKLTSYLIKELTSRYTFADHRGDSRYALWDENSRYDSYQWALQSFLQVPDGNLDATLQSLANCNGLTLIISCPPGYNKDNSDWFHLFTALGATPEQITTGGQWIIRDKEVLAYIPAHDGLTVTLNLNPVDTVTIKACEKSFLNGEELESHPGGFTLAVYDDYQYQLIKQTYFS